MSEKNPSDQATEITDDALDDATGGADAKRDIDYVGNYNFKVEIEGVTLGAFKTSFDTVSDK